MCLVAVNATASTVTLGPIDDNSIFSESTSNSDGAGAYLYSGQAGTGFAARRALLKFDCGTNLPALEASRRSRVPTGWKSARRRSKRLLSDRDDYFPSSAACFQVSDRLWDLFQAVTAIDDGSHLSRLHEIAENGQIVSVHSGQKENKFLADEC